LNRKRRGKRGKEREKGGEEKEGGEGRGSHHGLLTWHHGIMHALDVVMPPHFNNVHLCVTCSHALSRQKRERSRKATKGRGNGEALSMPPQKSGAHAWQFAWRSSSKERRGC